MADPKTEDAAKRKREMAKSAKLGVPYAVIGRQFGISGARVGQILGPKIRPAQKPATDSAQ